MKEWKAYGHNPELGITHAALVHMKKASTLKALPEVSSGKSDLFGAYYLYEKVSDFEEDSSSILVQAKGKAA